LTSKNVIEKKRERKIDLVSISPMF